MRIFYFLKHEFKFYSKLIKKLNFILIMRPRKNLFYYLFCCFCCKGPENNEENQIDENHDKKIEVQTKRSHVKLEVFYLIFKILHSN